MAVGAAALSQPVIESMPQEEEEQIISQEEGAAGKRRQEKERQKQSTANPATVMSQQTIGTKRVTRASTNQDIGSQIVSGTKLTATKDDTLEESNKKLAGKKRKRPSSPNIEEEEVFNANEEEKEFKQILNISNDNIVNSPKKKRGRPAKLVTNFIGELPSLQHGQSASSFVQPSLPQFKSFHSIVFNPI